MSPGGRMAHRRLIVRLASASARKREPRVSAVHGFTALGTTWAGPSRNPLLAGGPSRCRPRALGVPDSAGVARALGGDGDALESLEDVAPGWRGAGVRHLAGGLETRRGFAVPALRRAGGKASGHETRDDRRAGRGGAA